MEFITGVSALTGRFDGYIVDLWGTVHNGVAAYPGAVECLQALKSAGKRIVLLSNAPRPAVVVRAQLTSMGIDGGLYDGVMTSGQLTYDLLRRREDASLYEKWPWLEGLGNRVLHIGGQHDLALFDGLGLELVDHPGDADFVMNTGPDERRGRTDPEPYLETLAACVVRDLPMVCANPDMEVIRGGERLICAGLLARIYEEKGGVAHWIGKPYPAVYEPVLERLGVSRDRVIGIGDALATDMRGAAAAGVAGLWVLGGIHGEKLGNDPALAVEESRGAGVAPVAAVPRFVW